MVTTWRPGFRPRHQEPELDGLPTSDPSWPDNLRAHSEQEHTKAREGFSLFLSLPPAKMVCGTAFALGNAITALARAVSRDGFGKFLVVQLPLTIYTTITVEQATHKCPCEVRALPEEIPGTLCEDQRNME